MILEEKQKVRSELKEKKEKEKIKVEEAEQSQKTKVKNTVKELFVNFKHKISFDTIGGGLT